MELEELLELLELLESLSLEESSKSFELDELLESLELDELLELFELDELLELLPLIDPPDPPIPIPMLIELPPPLIPRPIMPAFAVVVRRSIPVPKITIDLFISMPSKLFNDLSVLLADTLISGV
ncbi:hypothetical protein [Kaarinaea lacus]